MENLLEIFTDGGARGNPGPASGAFLIYENKKLIQKKYKYFGKKTNNEAEYMALNMSIEWLLENKIFTGSKSILFFLDSELVVNQLNGLYKIKSENLKILSNKTKDYMRKLNLPMSIKYIPRKNNKEADALVNKCLDEN